MKVVKYVYAPHTRKPYGSTRPITGARQLQVFTFIKSRIDDGCRFPSPEEIRDHMGWRNTSGAYHVCARLARDGKLVRLRERAWAWKLA